MSESDDRVREYVEGLPEASGTFTGTFDPDSPWFAALRDSVPDLMPVEIDTYDKPNPAWQYMPGGMLTITIGDERWTFPIDHAEPLGGNRVRVWVRRPGMNTAPADVTDDTRTQREDR